jgi:DNA-binding CsgD family transcriptional regulator
VTVPAREFDAVRASVATLRAIDVAEPLGPSRYAAAVAREIRGLLGESVLACVYRPAREARDWSVAAEGPGADTLHAELPTAATAGAPFFLYDPLRPSAKDRNAVRLIERDDLPAGSRAFFDRLPQTQGQTRMLLCDGPILLAWVGILRAAERRYAVDRRVIRAVAIGVRRRMRLAFGVPRDVERATFEASLDAYAGEAYVVRRTGRVEYANALGHARLAVAWRELEPQLAESVARYPAQTGGFELHPLGGRGVPAFFLATRPSVAPGDLEARLTHAAARWALTPRHVDVLRRLALGDANKEIASRLQISARTVEEHVAVMIARAKVDSRLRLVARLWVGD